MKEATFYILNKTTPHERYLFACRLAEKANQQGLTMAISITSPELAQHIDTLLWSYRPDSFLPHELTHYQHGSNSINLIVLGKQVENKANYDITLNLDDSPDISHDLGNRHIEIAIQDPGMLKTLRQTYKQLQQKNIPVEVHDFCKSTRQ